LLEEEEEVVVEEQQRPLIDRRVAFDVVVMEEQPWVLVEVGVVLVRLVVVEKEVVVRTHFVGEPVEGRWDAGPDFVEEAEEEPHLSMPSEVALEEVASHWSPCVWV